MTQKSSTIDKLGPLDDREDSEEDEQENENIDVENDINEPSEYLFQFSKPADLSDVNQITDQNAACSSTDSRLCIKQFAFESEIKQNIKIEKDVEEVIDEEPAFKRYKISNTENDPNIFEIENLKSIIRNREAEIITFSYENSKLKSESCQFKQEIAKLARENKDLKEKLRLFENLSQKIFAKN